MAVIGVTHDQEGVPLTRVPVKIKVALGLPRGYEDPVTGAKSNAPRKLFHFHVQTRNVKSGKWEFDPALHKELFKEVAPGVGYSTGWQRHG